MRLQNASGLVRNVRNHKHSIVSTVTPRPAAIPHHKQDLLKIWLENILLVMGYGGWPRRYCDANYVIMVYDVAAQARDLLQPHITMDQK